MDDYWETMLLQKGSEKGNAIDNYRPISCLQLMWKLMTLISENVYKLLDENGMLPEEQRGYKRSNMGIKDQLLVDKSMLTDCKNMHKNPTMAWIHYKKAYDMVLHSWIIEYLGL